MGDPIDLCLYAVSTKQTEKQSEGRDGSDELLVALQA